MCKRCICSELEAVGKIKAKGFSSYEFEEFEGYVTSLVSRERLVQMDNSQDRTLKCTDCGQKWVVKKPNLQVKGYLIKGLEKTL